MPVGRPSCFQSRSQKQLLNFLELESADGSERCPRFGDYAFVRDPLPGFDNQASHQGRHEYSPAHQCRDLAAIIEPESRDD